MTKFNLPTDIWQQCLWIVRGYERCRDKYQKRARELNEDLLPFRQMRAVDHALDLAVDDLPLGQRQNVRSALLLFCQDGNGFDFDMLDELRISKKDFCLRRQHLLYEIAVELGLVIDDPERK